MRLLGRDFAWGVATSAYQIEGAVDVDGRGPSIWDTFARQPGRTVNGESGAVACDHYRRWADDVAMIAGLGLDAYRFSIAWPRVQPQGRGAFNVKGLDFYDRLVDGLLERGIAPHATLYHWDLPQALQDLGGWGNRDTAFHFATYADAIARRLGDRLASLATHNEPWCTAVLGHEIGKFAPGDRDPQLAAQVSHHLLLSHGLAMSAMRASGAACPLGIVLNQSGTTPATDSAADRAAAATEYARFVRWYMDPLFLGRYPVDAGIAHYPEVRDGDMALIQAPLDFLGVNFYTRIWVSRDRPERPAPMALGQTDMGWEVYPDGLRELLVGLKDQYRDLPPIFITENGMANADTLADGRVADQARIDYVRRHLEALAQAKAAGVDVRGYFYWSLMDNYEWDSGYAKRFGLVHVDYATQQRTLKDSAHWYRDTIAAVRHEGARADQADASDQAVPGDRVGGASAATAAPAAATGGMTPAEAHHG
ncbi:GH1 family beta-glucosidase [Roseateles chitosanitabidus]|uniref:GH1 family beta-glucosidase n=1 Tax=Roseateles chitosanitabidus TaxID=65048 RepID=UPI002352B6B1|nr:GH1 family beta-glucosidase [Roseateles chitosanitabidus]